MSAFTSEIVLTHIPSFTTNVTDTRPTAMPIANGTRQECVSYLDPPMMLPPVFIDGIEQNRTYSFSCSDVAAGHNTTVAQLKNWNPSLGPANSTTNCVLSPAYRYCVRDNFQQVNATSACIQYEMARPGMTCQSFAGRYGLDFKGQFRAWNPMVQEDCTGFQTGMFLLSLCLTYRQPGQVAACNKWVIANNTNWFDKPCQIIETKFGMNHNRFVAWNPAVLSNCKSPSKNLSLNQQLTFPLTPGTEIYPRYEYCVSIPNFIPTYTTISSTAAPTATTTTRSTPPGKAKKREAQITDSPSSPVEGDAAVVMVTATPQWDHVTAVAGGEDSHETGHPELVK
ncbi:hypothetical protein B0T25DRAFT_447803 [Lasiosphaeria hispida]|uniref:LysM domain-containing protein n=1 Tax=Lasiosphaeria hispida TaxID=260671 RepID=A0AAJ0HSM4_9PEZI|nr:hypothetical protein B0T25DRAFT_447803 [Lasiosphaeria hispida]